MGERILGRNKCDSEKKKEGEGFGGGGRRLWKRGGEGTEASHGTSWNGATVPSVVNPLFYGFFESYRSWRCPVNFKRVFGGDEKTEGKRYAFVLQK